MTKKPDHPKDDADNGSILGNIILEEVVEAIEAVRSPTPDIFPPIPHEVRPSKDNAVTGKGDERQEAEKTRPDSPGHHSR
ncbi:hypothetical protein [Nitrospirillum iridis]|uniref:Uncharacterized protein n=1 Tax=Nitrospirillum iridis TaxID=765888 RepID=A0A7X0AW94_9PROT|nr:hypothetical protein [Nitrospirillum iridis]MBB6251258.1 hypothetical protein [Nitrospirillum iridis]